MFVALVGVPPYQIQQLRTGIDSPGMSGKLKQEVKLFGRQVYRPAAACDRALFNVNRQIARLDRCLRAWGDL